MMGSSSVSSMPYMQFLFVRPRFCLQLLSDSASRRTPLSSANSSYCQACSGLSPPSYYACRAHITKGLSRTRATALWYQKISISYFTRFPRATMPPSLFAKKIEKIKKIRRYLLTLYRMRDIIFKRWELVRSSITTVECNCRVSM